MKYKIEKNTVQETLILPLYSRKLCTELYPNLYRDETAVRLMDEIDYDFSEAEKKRTAAVLVVTIFAVTALSASFCVWAALDVLVVSALVFCYYKWKSSKYFGGITGDLAGYFLSLCELAQLLSLVVLSLGMENWK